MHNQYDTILDAIEGLKRKGYVNSFVMTDHGLFSPDTHQTFSPDQVRIAEFHRSEGMTDLEDMSIVYAVETMEGINGIIVDAFGTYADSRLGDFLRKTAFLDDN